MWEVIMKKLVATVLFGTLFSVSAMAGEATVLTGKALDQVTAGFTFQRNWNYTNQNATAVAIGGCSFFCNKSGNASAVASNVNVTKQEND
jgi:hypothetical protein